jgi:DNA modification methylase
MLQDALIDLSDRGDIVIEPFGGSGSTLIACEKTGRLCRAVELDPLYVDVIVRGYQEFSGCDARLDGTEETFNNLEERKSRESQDVDE